MRVLIVEDEPPIADYIEKSLRAILGAELKDVQTAYSLEEAGIRLARKNIDVCFLDLNLSGRDGYEILEKAVSRPFQTIVISAHTEQAARAFEYGVIDFVPKPFNRDRLRLALDRCLSLQKNPFPARFLTFRKNNRNGLLPIGEILLLKATRYLVEVWMKDGRRELIEKPLNRLEKILPESFARIHRTYIVNLDQVESYKHLGGSRYAVRLKNGGILPMSRHRLPELKRLFGQT
ncbi:MAG: response regulator transcription factor [Candidatus Aminicenantes bacterium]|nr:response regulator transcription factor [Candidatus Aminicenantes bacterium]